LESAATRDDNLIIKEGEGKEALSSFIYALKSKGTQKQYLFRLKIFFDFMGLSSSSSTVEQAVAIFLDKVKQSPPDWAENCLIKFITHNKRKIEDNKLSATSLSNYVIAVRLFYEMNNIQFNWKRVSRGLPKSRTIAADRAPTIEEIQKIVEYSDKRIRSIVYVMCSSGIRVGAWEWLKWKHVVPIPMLMELQSLLYMPGNQKNIFRSLLLKLITN
jgi:hypothetical protein